MVANPKTKTTKVQKSSNLNKFFREEKEQSNDLAIGVDQTYTEFEVERIHQNSLISKAMTKARKNWKTMMIAFLRRYKNKICSYQVTLLDKIWADGAFRKSRFQELLATNNLQLIRWFQYYRGWDQFHAAKITNPKSCHKVFDPTVNYWIEFEDFHVNSILATNAMLFRKHLSDHW